MRWQTIRILILTHNILNECAIQEDLQRFNYEVLVSKTMLDMIIYTEEKWEFEFFPIVILSESLSNKELEKIVPILKERQVVIFRKCLRAPLTEEKEILKELEINEWFDNSISIEALRELISIHTDTPSSVPLKKERHLISMSFEQLLTGFSKNQRKCFLNLYNAKASTITRKELCQNIWGDEPTKSNLSQLSVLIKELRQKLAEKGFPSNVIGTVWGNGYVLKKEFFNLYRDTELVTNDILYQ